jgi:predicted ATP-grasp superfamily ATP-dependent carboligase
MKLFIYEHLTSGALAQQSLPESLVHEGELMLQAIVQDLSRLGQCELRLMRDKRLPALSYTSITVDEIETEQDHASVWSQRLNDQDAFFIIAPETDQILLNLQQQVIDHGKTHFGCSQAATATCSDKALSYQALKQASIATPETWTVADWLTQSHAESAWVLKPIDGAGSENTYLCANTEQARELLSNLEEIQAQLIIQPFISGKPLSLNLFINQQQLRVLSLNEQYLQQNQQQLMMTHTAAINFNDNFSKSHAEQWAKQITQALPGLNGFIGIDFILSKHGPVLIEINPRLTLSYIHLKQQLSDNPCQLLLPSFDTLSV